MNQIPINDEQRSEIIKALAYGKHPQEIAHLGGIPLSTVNTIMKDSATEIVERSFELKNGGYKNG